MSRARLTALLVGIDLYRPSALGYPSYRPLRGAVADVREVHLYLTEERGVDTAAITLLTASDARRRASRAGGRLADLRAAMPASATSH